MYDEVRLKQVLSKERKSLKLYKSCLFFPGSSDFTSVWLAKVSEILFDI